MGFPWRYSYLSQRIIRQVSSGFFGRQKRFIACCCTVHHRYLTRQSWEVHNSRMVHGRVTETSTETQRMDVSFESGRKHVVTMDVQYVDVGGRKGDNNQVVLALHGCPGSHKDMLPFLPLTEQGYRVLIPNFPGYGYTVGKTEGDQTSLYHSNQERVNFLLAFLDALNIHRVDTILAHSAGSFPSLLLASEHRDLVKSLVMFNPPPPHKRYRIVKPYWLVRALANGYDIALTRPVVSLIVKIGFQSLGFTTRNVEFMIPAAQMAGRLHFKHITELARDLGKKKIPVVMAYTMNDPFLEAHLCQEYVGVLGIPENQVHIHGSDGQLLNQPVSDDDIAWYKKVFQLSRSGHFPQKHQPYLDILLNETRQILQHVECDKGSRPDL